MCYLYRTMNSLFTLSFYFVQLRALGAEGMVNEMIRHLQRAENMYVETATYNIVLQSLLEANEVKFLFQSFHCISVTHSAIILIVILN